MSASLLERAVKRRGPDAVYAALSEDAREQLRYTWEAFARPEQLLPLSIWRIWLILAGRGFGKTRTGAETVRQWVRHYQFVNLIGATVDDARDIMIEGESGIMAICPREERPYYRKASRQLEWQNGAKSLIFTADEPERLRGKQSEKVWADEVAAWRYSEAWTQMMLGLRLGDNPQAVATTTPRPTPLIKGLIAAPTTHVTRGTTYDNRANLAPAFFDDIIRIYEGTRLGRQELMAEVLDDVPGALWQRAKIDELRLSDVHLHDMARIVVAVDPAVTNTEGSDETGIVVVGKGIDGHGYVLADLSCRMSPDGWARRAVDAYHTYRADRLVAEVNNGGDLVEGCVRTVDPHVSYRAVRASRGKLTRAEPIAALYEQGRVHHVGSLPHLEDQMCMYTPDGYDGSPDRVDALVWAASELMLGAGVPTLGDDIALPKRRI